MTASANKVSPSAGARVRVYYSSRSEYIFNRGLYYQTKSTNRVRYHPKNFYVVVVDC
jgi:hypothetical protein